MIQKSLKSRVINSRNVTSLKVGNNALLKAVTSVVKGDLCQLPSLDLGLFRDQEIFNYSLKGNYTLLDKPLTDFKVNFVVKALGNL